MHTPARIAAIALVFGAACVSWMILGGVTTARTGAQSGKLRGEVGSLWGSPQAQEAPSFAFDWETEAQRERWESPGDGKPPKRIVETVKEAHSRDASPDHSAITARLGLDQRLRGLMWYALYGVTFDGAWRLTHTGPETGKVRIGFKFPVPDAIYDDFRFVVNGRDLARTLIPQSGALAAELAVAPGDTVALEVHYASRGMDSWTYVPGRGGVASLHDFRLAVSTDFGDFDYPSGGMSPSARQKTADGWTLGWTFAQVLTGHSMGLLMPQRIQPGELAARLAFSAPVSLAFFFVIVFVLSVLRRLDVHPVNYLALASAFFAFHLLFAYSVDHLNLFAAFALASAASIVLVTTYLRLVVGARFAFREAAAAQLVYQVGFSLAHFWDGYTGLTVSVLATVTLFVLMQLTGRVRWSQVLGGAPPPRPPIPAPAAAGGMP